MATIAKLYNTGKLSLLEGNLNERLPATTDGLTHHFPFDGTTSAVYSNIKYGNLNILDYNSHATTWNMKYVISNGDIASGTVTTNDSASQATALTYDMVVTDEMVWAVDQSVMNTLKTWAEAGCVCWATGNDTTTNNLILSRTVLGAETVYTATMYNDLSLEVYLGPDTAGSAVNGTSGDPNYSITTMHEDCIPLYWHDFVDDTAIMGFLYLPNNGNGGSLFFDMFGYTASHSANWGFLRHLLNWQLNQKRVSSLVTTDSNTTHMVDGVSVETLTTNIITSSHAYYPNFRPYSGIAHSNESVISTDVPPAIDGIDVYRITDNALDTQNMRYSLKFNIVDDNIWDVDVTYSIYIWFPEKFKDRLLSFTDGMFQNTVGSDWHGTQGWDATYNFWGAGSIESNVRTPDLSKTNCWQKYSITGKALVANRYNDFGDAGTGSPDNKYIAGYLRVNVSHGVSGSSQPSPFFFYITAPQLEEKNYHTEFVDGNRAGDGDLIISGLNIDTASEDFTLNFKIDTNGAISPAITNKIELNNFGKFWRYYPTNTTNSVKWVWDWVASSRVYEDLNSTTLFNTGYETITITYDHDATTYGQLRFFRNGVYWEVDNGTSICTRGVIDQIQILDLGASIKDLSLFNKELSDDQIYKLANSGHNFLDGETNLITNEVREYPDLPSTYYTRYFPLDDNANDKNKVISPSTETNTVYEDRSVWIGQETINLLYQSGGTPLANASDLYGRSIKTDLGNGRYLFVNNGTGISLIRMYCNLTDLTNGETYGCQISFEHNNGTLVIDWCDTTITGVNTSSDPYGKLHGTGSRGTYDATYRFFDITLTSGTSVILSGDQVEAKPFCSPFVNGTRGDIFLNYASSNLTQAAGAICGWYEFNENARTWRGPANNNDWTMLFNTHGASSINTLSVESYYGSTANTWSVHTENASYQGTWANHVISDGWHFICLAWDTVTGYRKFFVDGSKEEDISAYLPVTYNSDLRIGNYDTTNFGNMNQYVRDLIILDYYPPDDEIQDIYRKTMSSSKDMLRVNYEIEEE